MRTAVLLRIASITTLLFAGGHTIGGLQSWSPPGNTEVLQAMRSFHFDVDGYSRTYWDFYVGFGLIISVFLVAQAVLLWQLATLSTEEPVRVRPVVTVLFVAVVVNAILAWRFFFAIPLVLGIVTASCLVLALRPRLAWALRSRTN